MKTLYTKQQMIDYALENLSNLAGIEPNPEHENPLNCLSELPEENPLIQHMSDENLDILFLSHSNSTDLLGASVMSCEEFKAALSHLHPNDKTE